LSLLSVIGLGLVFFAPESWADGECTVNCPATTDVTTGAAAPCPGSTFVFDPVGSASPGQGTANCAATCTQCRQGVVLVWNNHGNSDCCLQFDLGGASGPNSPPLPKYNRSGTIITNCDDFDVYSIQMLPCAGGGAFYTKSITLYCGCGFE
jgi:hypothetical protein